MISINDADFKRLVCFVRENFGINLENKRTLIDARLAFDLSRRGFGDFTRYVNTVIAAPDGEECRRMMNRLSTNYTFFFREPDYIGQLSDKVLPDLIARGRRQLRVWSAACSSGQEAYSIAMVLEAQRRLLGADFDFEIVGTDINTETLQTAALGQYPGEELARIPKQYRMFTVPHADGSFEVAAALRQRTSWTYGNLLEECAGLDRFDLIFCRNVMIYFTQQLRRDMAEKLYARLLPGGYLFTGTTESIDLERKFFRYLSPAFYQKTSTRLSGGVT